MCNIHTHTHKLIHARQSIKVSGPWRNAVNKVSPETSGYGDWPKTASHLSLHRVINSAATLSSVRQSITDNKRRQRHCPQIKGAGKVSLFVYD